MSLGSVLASKWDLSDEYNDHYNEFKNHDMALIWDTLPCRPHMDRFNDGIWPLPDGIHCLACKSHQELLLETLGLVWESWLPWLQWPQCRSINDFSILLCQVIKFLTWRSWSCISAIFIYIQLSAAFICPCSFWFPSHGGEGFDLPSGNLT